MTGPANGPSARWQDAILAARVLAVAPHAVGGLTLRARSGPVRERWLWLLRTLAGEAANIRRLPLNVPDDRLLGGLDLAATLARGRPVAEPGLLAQADGGLLIVPSAERLAAGAIAHLSAALDQGRVNMERDGLSLRLPARFGIVALDEGAEPDEIPASALLDRLALRVDLDGLSLSDCPILPAAEDIAHAQSRLAHVHADPASPELFCQAAIALGIASLRAPLQAIAVARIAAALAGRSATTAADAEAAARLVLAPRATRLPDMQDQEPEQAANEPPPPPEPQQPDDAETQPDTEPENTPLPEELELLLAAAAAAIPAALLDSLAANARPSRLPSTPGKGGTPQTARTRGRPAGVRRGMPRNGNVLSLIDTLRTAAPWQTLRRQHTHAPECTQPVVKDAEKRRIEVRASDLRIAHFKQKTNSTTIFVVDASGSSALHRLAEAKGAVEAILSECYVRRDSVALIAFRGKDAETLLPPTRSLTRAQRCLAALPGGGGTPLAKAIDSAAELAAAQKKKGIAPTLVLLTDGRANIGRDGEPGRGKAMTDAHASADALRALGITTLLIDTSPRRNAEAETLAEHMGARYLPLPHADSERLAKAVLATRNDTGGPSGAPR